MQDFQDTPLFVWALKAHRLLAVVSKPFFKSLFYNASSSWVKVQGEMLTESEYMLWCSIILSLLAIQCFDVQSECDKGVACFSKFHV